MIFLYLVFIIIFLLGLRFTKKDFNENYLDKDITTTINGMFVITVFFSHFLSYLQSMNKFDGYLAYILGLIGQLMVTSFLFYSGYGIYESIKNKKDYMKSFFKKRFLPTFVNFAVVVLIYIILNLILGNNYDIKTNLLAFLGYESIGNSNWYMLAVFSLYIFTIISFSKLFKAKDIYRILLLISLTIIYVMVIGKFKDSFYVDTLLCFPTGILYSYFKEKINKIVFKHYYIYLVIVLLLFLGVYYLNIEIPNICFHNIKSILFILLIVFLTMKIKIKSKVFYYFGVYTFWIYILQRIPMILFKDYFNTYLYFAICFVLTIIISILLKKIMDKVWGKVLRKG